MLKEDFEEDHIFYYFALDRTSYLFFFFPRAAEKASNSYKMEKGQTEGKRKSKGGKGAEGKGKSQPSRRNGTTLDSMTNFNHLCRSTSASNGKQREKKSERDGTNNFLIGNFLIY